MLPTTANLVLPYPALSSSPNVPSDLAALAAQIEAQLGTTYTSVTPTFYSNIVAGTAISGASVVVTYAKYRLIAPKTCHYFGHATINTTVTGGNGFGLSLPIATPYRSFSMQTVAMHGASGNTNYAQSTGEAHVPAISAPYNRVGPVDRQNALLGVVTSGDTVHWNITYETV